MKKIFILALTALFVAGMIADVAVAEDRIDVSGSMRVRAWKIEKGDADATEYWDQRFRLQTSINIADGVKAVTRMDFSEDKWGSDNWEGSRYSSDSELQVDRAYLQVDKGIFSVTAGQQYIGVGNLIAYDNNGTGIKLQLKAPVLITLAYTKESEGGALTDEEDLGTEDIDTYMANIGYSNDNFSINAFYAAGIDGNDDGFEPNAFGIQGTLNAGMVSFNAELDVFGGEVSGYDVMGTQFYGNAEAALTDKLKLGIDVVYSDGNDSDDEIKITGLNDFNGTGFMDRGPFNTDIMPGGQSDIFDPTPYGFDTTTVSITTTEFGAQSGALGAGIYGVFTVIEGLNLHANVMMLSAVEDEVYDYWDDVMVFGIGAEWFFAPNTCIAAAYNNTSWSSDYDAIDDSQDTIVAKLQVNF